MECEGSIVIKYGHCERCMLVMKVSLLAECGEGGGRGGAVRVEACMW